MKLQLTLQGLQGKYLIKNILQKFFILSVDSNMNSFNCQRGFKLAF